MANNINVLEVLERKPNGTKLWCVLFGKCSLHGIDISQTLPITIETEKGYTFRLTANAKIGVKYTDGECLIFPSDEMRDWSKFSWKRGDILVSNDGGTMVIFDKWYDDAYTSFYCRHYLSREDKDHPVYYNEFLCTTDRYSFKNNQYANNDYIKAIEERIGRRLNLETLKPDDKLSEEVKDGDIITFNNGIILIYCANMVMLPERTEIYFHACLKNGKLMFNTYLMSNGFGGVQYSTEEEKIKLFDALTKDGKYWDAEIKKIVDIKPKVELKPFDKVLVRDYDYNAWQVSLFGYQSPNNYYYCCNGRGWIQCIPYEGNEHLLGRKF